MIRVQSQDFDPGQLLQDLQRAGHLQTGAVVSFTGLVRDINEGDAVSRLSLEHYPGMTEKALADIAAIAKNRWDLIDSVIVHRYGTLDPGDRIVFVAASSKHRKAAFRACELMIDRLKTDAPFWKKESTPQGERWLEPQDQPAAAAP